MVSVICSDQDDASSWNWRRNLKVDSVSRLNPTAPLRIEPEQTVADAVRLMRERRVGCLLVCRDDRLLGVFTERDLMRRVLAAGLPLTTPVPLHDAPIPSWSGRRSRSARRCGAWKRAAIVICLWSMKSGRPLGVLSVKRIVHYLAEHFPATVCNQPPDPASFPDGGGGGSDDEGQPCDLHKNGTPSSSAWPAIPATAFNWPAPS